MKTRSLLPLRFCLPFGLLAFLAVSSPGQAPKEGDKKEEKPGEAADANKSKVLPEVSLENVAELGPKADEFFAKADWLNAAAHYNALLGVAIKQGNVKPEMLEPLYFIIGVCMYNLPNYDEAYKRFTEYTQKYPTGPNVHPVNLAIARIFRFQKKWPEGHPAVQAARECPRPEGGRAPGAGGRL